jgi:hypothetical protein
MLTSKKSKTVKTELLLGDYITVHDSRLTTGGGNGELQHNLRISRESFIQRFRKQRGELFQRAKPQSGKLIDVRQRGVA